MTIRRIFTVISLCAAIALIGFATYVNIDNLVGAFGNGPPYYGRTTNMDKWANPIPFLMFFNLIVIGITYFVIRWALRTLKQGRMQ